MAFEFRSYLFQLRWPWASLLTFLCLILPISRKWILTDGLVGCLWGLSEIGQVLGTEPAPRKVATRGNLCYYCPWLEPSSTGRELRIDEVCFKQILPDLYLWLQKREGKKPPQFILITKYDASELNHELPCQKNTGSDNDHVDYLQLPTPPRPIKSLLFA